MPPRRAAFLRLQKGAFVRRHVYHTAGQPGFLNGAGHQVTFHTEGNGASGAGIGSGEAGGKVLHDSRITAAVATGGIFHMDGPTNSSFCLIPAEMRHSNGFGKIIGQNFTVFAHNVNIAVYVTGLRSQREGDSDAVFKFHEDAHMVANVVVAVVNTASIGAGFQRFPQGFFRRFQANNISGPFSKNWLVCLPGVKRQSFATGQSRQRSADLAGAFSSLK